MFPWLSAIPWRLVGYGAAVVAVLLFGWRVHAWHQGYLAYKVAHMAQERAEAGLRQCHAEQAVAAQAASQAATAAKAKELKDAEASRKVEHDLRTNLAAADARGRDLARRLRDATRSSGGPLPGASAVAGSVPEGAESGSLGETGSLAARIRDAEADYFGKCAADAAALDAVAPWYEALREGRN